MKLNKIKLGEISPYQDHYNKSLIRPIKRDFSHMSGTYSKGKDTWTTFEFSWLDISGKPTAKIVEFIFPSDSKYLIESKSFKYYLNSFNNTKFRSEKDVSIILKKDLDSCSKSEVEVKIYSLCEYSRNFLPDLPGENLDNLSVEIVDYLVNTDYLNLEIETIVEDSVNSNLLRTNCPVTNQPDWGSVFIWYIGKKINHEGLLKYIVSFRQHNGFHEYCIEKIYSDIMLKCRPKKLVVYGRYNRRGGLDINPLRYNCPHYIKNLDKIRLIRQ